MQLEQFFDKKYRKEKKFRINELDMFMKSKHDSWIIHKGNSELSIKAFSKQKLSESYSFSDYLNQTIPKHAVKFNEAIIDYFKTKNSFYDELPLFIIRRHGSRAGEEGSKMRRRGWLVRFNNAWIVYADNFLTRHFFEGSYVVDDFKSDDLKKMVISFSLPFSSGGGIFEKKHRVFPSISHLTSRSGFYLSHILDLNQNEYYIDGQEIKATEILGRGRDGKFGCGTIEAWDNGGVINENRYRIIKSDLSSLELSFLTAYNIRMLSPFNYFPFPKTSLLENKDLNGENDEVRKRCYHYYRDRYKKDFDNFLKHACAEN